MSQASKERLNQKARTRTALLESARTLVREGHRPTVEEAALAAGISKRTAYRYFDSQDHLLADAALEGLRPKIAEMLDAVSASDGVHSRVTSLARALSNLSTEHDSELREMIRASLNRGASKGQPGAPPMRGSRRLDWIRTALQPLDDTFSADQMAKLTDALAVCLGIDASMVLRDICGVTGAEAEDLMVWMATTMIDKAINEAGEAKEPIQ